ncbi:hypothetical protein CHS0354_010334 [Potamilus streckersoni]|uniref:Uncharacterized protein n=1 Tax=Potamilus streckersoni TaxID=2493646 RepID=A0AAE0TDR0_9BIVA|nr:hypothetical protein CHS0354_010334 [Potamilus streckersoni]
MTTRRSSTDLDITHETDALDKTIDETEQNHKEEPQRTHEKEESDEKPEVKTTVISRSTTDSSFVTDAKILLSDDKDDIDFTDNEFIISEEEKKEWDEMIKQKQDELVQQKEKFGRWEEEMTKRKMIVLGKLKRLNISHSKRMQFYTLVNGFVSNRGKVNK